MRIYCLRDRLIDYYMQPFAAPNHKAVLAAIAQTVNRQDGPLNDIQQAPHHFEIWQLGLVTEDGHLTPEREFIADVSSLVRSGVRKGEHPQDPEAPKSANSGSEAARDGSSGASANGSALSHPLVTAASQAEEVLRGPRGGYPPRGDG